MNSVVVGASAGLGRALADALARAGHDLVLVASDERDVNAVATDLRIRYKVRVMTVAADVASDAPYLEALSSAVEAMGGVDSVFLPVAAVTDEDAVPPDAATAERLLRVNFLSIVNTVGTLLPGLRRGPRAAVVGFGSVAACRGRSTNVVYAASKRALASFFESLRHANADVSVRVQYYVLGYLDTNMAFGRKLLLPKGSPDRLARLVVENLGRDVGVVHYPAYWRPICSILRWTPFSLFRRLRV